MIMNDGERKPRKRNANEEKTMAMQEKAARLAERFGWLHAAEGMRVGFVPDSVLRDVRFEREYWRDIGHNGREAKQLAELSQLCWAIRGAGR